MCSIFQDKKKTTTNVFQKVLLAHGSIAGHCELITVILAEVEGNDLAAILGFLYTGTAEVPEARLEAFSSTADALRITIPPLPPALTLPESPKNPNKYHQHFDCHLNNEDKIPMDLTTTPRVTANHTDVGLNLKIERMDCLRQLLAPNTTQEKGFKHTDNTSQTCFTTSLNIENNIFNNLQENCCINLKTPASTREKIKFKSHVANRVGASPWTQIVQLYHSPKIQPITMTTKNHDNINQVSKSNNINLLEKKKTNLILYLKSN